MYERIRMAITHEKRLSHALKQITAGAWLMHQAQRARAFESLREMRERHEEASRKDHSARRRRIGQSLLAMGAPHALQARKNNAMRELALVAARAAAAAALASHGDAAVQHALMTRSALMLQQVARRKSAMMHTDGLRHTRDSRAATVLQSRERMRSARSAVGRKRQPVSACWP